MARIILDQYTGTPRYTQYHVSSETSSPTPVSTLTHKASPFFLIGKTKTEQRTGQRSAFANKDACRGQPEGLRYFGGAFSDGYTCGGQVEGWRYAGRGHPGMCLPLGSAASPKRNGIPMFPRRDLCARVNPKATSRDRSGRGGLCQVWFLSKRGGSVATLGTTPAHPYLLSDLNEGTTNREMASPQSQTEQENQPSLCVASMSTKISYMLIQA